MVITVFGNNLMKQTPCYNFNFLMLLTQCNNDSGSIFWENDTYLSFRRRLRLSRNVIPRIWMENFFYKTRPGFSVKPDSKSTILYKVHVLERLSYEFTLNKSLGWIKTMYFRFPVKGIPTQYLHQTRSGSRLAVSDMHFTEMFKFINIITLIVEVCDKRKVLQVEFIKSLLRSYHVWIFVFKTVLK